MTTHNQSNNNSQESRRSWNHLPDFFKTDANKKFLSATLDQLIQPGTIEKINGYVGRREAKAFSKDDFYIDDVSRERQNYQLEPAAVIEDDIGNVDFYKDYIDYINQVENLGGDTSNHSLLNSQEFYSWNPNIDWDKLVNYREYYWLPNGPDEIPVFGQSKDVESTYKVETLNSFGDVSYLFTPDGLTPNPEIVLYRGIKYRFEINAPGNPLSFRTRRETARSWRTGVYYDLGNTVLHEGTIYEAVGSHRSSDNFENDKEFWTVDDTFNLTNEVSQQGVEDGVIEIELGPNTPDNIFYVSENTINAGGLVKVYDQEEATFIDVENEIVGKKSYTTGSNIELSNGMKIKFQGEVVPEKFAVGSWYVEGVGEAIRLISEEELNVPSSFTNDLLVEFDSEGFDVLPYSKAIGYPRSKDYITINRGSRDGNLWSKYNRWFHSEVIKESRRVNGLPLELDQSNRARKPIIEFKSDLKLSNFGTTKKKIVDLFDDFTNDVFSNIEGQQGYNIDGVDLVNGMRIIFNNDPDPLVKGKTYEVEFITFKNRRQIALRESNDSEPNENENVLVSGGTSFKGKIFWYDGNDWNKAQDKVSVNQPPYFEVFDNEGESLVESEKYESFSFRGTKLFSYKVGSGKKDSDLGFPIVYRNIQNTGDILFEFDLQEDIEIPETNEKGFLKLFTSNNEFEKVNGWIKSGLSKQPVIRQFVVNNTRTTYPVDVYDQSALVNDLWLRVYLNNDLLFKDDDYVFETDEQDQLRVKFLKNLKEGDSILFKTRSSEVKNNNGKYEVPKNLERNPLNKDLEELTLGEINSHYKSIVEEIDNFKGNIIGSNNIRDLEDVSSLGKRVIKHSSPLNLSLFHLIDNQSNLLKSIRFAKSEYAKFKRNFLQVSFELGFNGPVKDHVDEVLNEIARNDTKKESFQNSDMVPLKSARRTNFEIFDEQETFFSLKEEFDIKKLSIKAVLVYKNNEQLLYGRDYEFQNNDFVKLTTEIEVGDVISVYEYENTSGVSVPQTPTKLGLYPKFTPTKFVDDTYLEPQEVIQGHDGSIVKAFNDFRDDLLLDLEKRIYNNIKIEYNPKDFDIHDFVPGEYRDTNVSLQNINRILHTDFTQWTNLVNQNINDLDIFERTNQFTFNHKDLKDSNSNKISSGFWRFVYQRAYDTVRPHTRPWEMLGFSEKPVWWNDQYGPEPYTSENLLLWEDLEQGIVRRPNEQPEFFEKYKRPGLTSHLPVDESGFLVSPVISGYIKGYNTVNIDSMFEFGDHSPVETAWRRSSEYPFSLLASLFVNQPCRVLATGFDRSRQYRNDLDQIVYENPNSHLQLEKLKFPSSSSNNIEFTSGFINYVKEYIGSSVNFVYEDYKQNLKKIDNKIGFRLGGFSSKEKINFILDSRTPENEGNVFIPNENYKLFLNKSSPIESLFYSGVTIQKKRDGFLIRGYNENFPFFSYNRPVKKEEDRLITVGEVSENFVEWEPNKRFSSGTIVENGNSFFITKETHTSGSSFDSEKFQELPSLPTTGGREAKIREDFENNVSFLPYGTFLETIQEVVDFILGYANLLNRQGFVFEHFSKERQVVEDWITSVKEFLFWTTQNWSEGSIIALSAGASEFKFDSRFSVVDNVFDTFFGYSVSKVDGRSLRPEFIDVSRKNSNQFEISSKKTQNGIYSVRLPLVQKEHVVVFDNKTDFNDIVYDQRPGFRQERIKVLGYRTSDWSGSLNIPGFIFDEAKVNDWEPWKDYANGDLVKFKEFFYVAKQKVSGKADFDSNDWARLDGKPEAGLIPNFEYKTRQFSDFYDLDTDNFDNDQQKFAQHLIGYQNRNYLENIINDDVSQYKFYQGFIQEKGSRNSFDKLFSALRDDNKPNLEFYEEWALRTGEYGASKGFEEVEYIINENQTRLNPQTVKLVDSLPEEKIDLVQRIRPFEVYLAPNNYNHRPFPEKNVGQDSFVYTSGYVNPEDVEITLPNLNLILDVNFEDLFVGDNVWVTNEGKSWNVYSYSRTGLSFERFESDNNRITLFFSTSDHGLQEGEIVGVYSEEIKGFFFVSSVLNNEVTVENSTDEDFDNTTDTKGTIFRFLPVRYNDLFEVNQFIQGHDKDLRKIWVDNSKPNVWEVFERNDSYNKNQILTSDVKQNGKEFASTIDVNDRNTILAVGSPEEENGKVYIYTRSFENSEYELFQVIEPVKNNADSNQKFGYSVSMSPDASYIAVGSPYASNVKTLFRGKYNEKENYTKGEIVEYKDRFWKASEEILGEVSSIEFESFNSVPQILEDKDLNDANDKDVPVLFAGDYPFTEVDTDHFLVRAPKEMFLGSEVGDKVSLSWNLLTYSNFDINSLVEKEPFSGNNKEITSDFLSKEHVIVEKIDCILKIDTPTIIPSKGQIVETSEASGEVFYVAEKENQISLYVRNQNGDFNDEGTITTQLGEFVGNYILLITNSDLSELNDFFQGFWFFNTEKIYKVDSIINQESAKGLVYKDLIPANDTESTDFYYNVLDFNTTDVRSFDTTHSQITALTYEGLPGPDGVSGVFSSSLYVFRAPKPLTDKLSVNSPGSSNNDVFDLFYNPSSRDFNTGFQKKLGDIGLSEKDVNQRHIVYDLWDGYIDVDITKSFNNEPLEPKEGLIIRDVDNQGTAEITFYQKFDSINVRLYIKNTSDVNNWSLGREFGDNSEIEFLADGSGDPVFDPDSGSRVFGEIESRSLGYEPENIGQLVVIDNGDNIKLSNNDTILDSEYWFFRKGIVQGAPRQAILPDERANKWTQVFKVPVNPKGNESGFTNEGLVDIYKRTGSSNVFLRQESLVSVSKDQSGNLISKDNNFFGKKVSLAKLNEFYRLFVEEGPFLDIDDSSDVNNNSVDFEHGKIHVIKKGQNNGQDFDWEYGTNKEYRGEFNFQSFYNENDIVFNNGKIYQASTNIPSGKSFDINDWELIERNIDITGYIPNDTGLVIDNNEQRVLDQETLVNIAVDFDHSDDGEVLVTSVKYLERDSNVVIVYRSIDGGYVKDQEIGAGEDDSTDQSGFGNSIAISHDGRYIAVGSPFDNSVGLSKGVVHLYKQENGLFHEKQKLYKSDKRFESGFGTSIDFDTNETLAVGLRNTHSELETTFDNDETTFDLASTRFKKVYETTGTVAFYQNINDVFVYGQELEFEEFSALYFGKNILSKRNHFYASLPRLEVSDSEAGTLIDFRRSSNIWKTISSEKATVDVDKIKRAMLYNTKTNEFLTYLDYIDVRQGKIAGLAEQEISYKTLFDPAIFTDGTGINIDQTNSWGRDQVGQLWWDLSNARFKNPYQEGITFSSNTWNEISSRLNTIDVYEWVETTLLPLEWDEISETEEGFARGVTGFTKYGNELFSRRRVYDSASKTFSNLYYYWVRNKLDSPRTQNRNLSANDVAELIKDPKKQGYRYISFISSNEFALHNVNDLFEGNNVALSVQYWTIEDQSINLHRQYQIISEGVESERPDKDVELKWFDSLVGKDRAGREVPNRNLSPKVKYGTLNDPIQSWFVNRNEALKEVVSRVNRVLEKNLISDEKNISRLDSFDEPPKKNSGVFDLVVESEKDLDFVGFSRAKRAQISPEIENGKIIDVNIDDPGKGYLNAPGVEISGSEGEGAELVTELDANGSVDDIIVKKSGENYSDQTRLNIRRFAVLVESDQTIDGDWAVYERDQVFDEWTRVSSQSFDVRKYWDFKDWYKEGYSELTPIDYVIDYSYQLSTIDDLIGNVIKILNVGSGGWILLEKVKNRQSSDTTVNYKTIGREDGTIELKESLYNSNKSKAGYDVPNYDIPVYDNLPSIETRIILETIRDEIFTGSLAIEYNRLFFSSLRYVFSEQNFVDWAFKTSFLKVNHNVGDLEQKITFQNDNLQSFEDYVQEVKPYKSNIREFLNTYKKVDDSENVVTDFDLPPDFDNSEDKILPKSVGVDSENNEIVHQNINTFPDKHWLENALYSVERIEIADAGNGYTQAPIVKVTGGRGKDVDLQTFLGIGGKIKDVKVINKGSGFVTTPNVVVNGSIEEGGRPAKLVPILSGSPVRTPKTQIKFDRVSGEFNFVELETTEVFNEPGNQRVFTLKWPLNLRSNKVSVFVNGNKILKSRYTQRNVLDQSKGYDRYLGEIAFNEIPETANNKVEIRYYKDISLLNAQDRIGIQYNLDEAFELGKFMGGIDYGGVEVRSFEFGNKSGWDADPWMQQRWDVFDTTFEDEIFNLDGSTVSVELNKPLEDGVTYNIYRIARDSDGNLVSNQRLDDPNYGTSDQTNDDAVTESIVGDGETKEIFLDNLGVLTTPQNDDEDSITVIIRKITSDGSFLPDPERLDTVVTGGDLAYQTATGLDSGDITVDGDGFVTPTTSGGPEEVVPGHVLDTLDLKVFERPTGQVGNIEYRNIVSDGKSNEINLASKPASEYHVFVKVNNRVLRFSEFTINFAEPSVILNEVPEEGNRVSVVTLDHSAENIVGIDDFVTDGETREYLTDIGWKEGLDSFVTLDGQPAQASIKASDESYEISGKVVVVFNTTPVDNKAVSILVSEGELSRKQYNQILFDRFVADGSTTVFDLDNSVIDDSNNAMTLVIVNGKLLEAPYTEKFTLSETNRYSLDRVQVPVGTISSSDLKVYLNEVELEPVDSWIFDGFDFNLTSQQQTPNSIILKEGVGKPGDELKVVIVTGGEFRHGYFDDQKLEFVETPDQIYFDSAFKDGDVINVFRFTSRSSLGLERMNLNVVFDPENIEVGTETYFDYRRLNQGTIKLRKIARDDQYVWVSVNGNLLSASIDYKISDDKRFVILSEELKPGDHVQVIHFAGEEFNSGFSWRQFKDMLNRNHYKKIGQEYILAEDLYYYQGTIEVVDATDLPLGFSESISEDPGVIFIDGERIEYFHRVGNSLKQLRRGTLGTGVKEVHNAGTTFVNQSRTETIPYKDESDIMSVQSDGVTSEYEIEINTSFENSFFGNVEDIFEVFVAGRRLRKTSVDKYDSTIAQDSPEGDITLEPQFKIENGILKLKEVPEKGSSITVVRKIGKTWSDFGVSLAESNNRVSKFLRHDS